MTISVTGSSLPSAVGEPAITTLPDGLRVVTEHVPGVLSVSAGVWVGVGARDEPAPLCGVSHFLEHLLFKGTRSRSARDIAAAVDRVGGDMNAYTAKEFTAYYCRVPARDLGLALDLLGDVVTSPALRDADIESERQVILEELAMDEDSPDDTAYRYFGEALFPDHPLGRETAGDVDTVETIRPDDVREFFARNYRSGSMVVAVAGPVEHDAVVEAVRSAFAGVAAGTAPVKRSAPQVAPVRSTGEHRECEQVHLVVGVRGVDRFDDDREALDVVTHVLGGGPSSRLFQTIREERGLAYSTFAGLSVYGDAGSLSAYAATNPEHAREVLDLVQHEFDQLLEHGIGDDELEIARGYLTGAYAMGFEGTGARADRLGGQLIGYGKIRSIDEQIARWERVTHADVRRVIQRVLSGPRVVCTVGPVPPGLAP